MSTQRCFLVLAGSLRESAEYFSNIGDAVAEFESVARELRLYGQEMTATLHFVSSREEEPAEYPDRVLSIGPLGGLRNERT